MAVRLDISHDRDLERDCELVVRSVDHVAQDVVALTFACADGGALPPWSPGAHVDLHLGPGLTRQYSLCGDPGDGETWRLAVLLTDESRGGSQRVHALSPGDTVRARGPRNKFSLEPSPRYLFIAGGIGITPIVPMIATAAAIGAEWELLYGGRTRSSMAFRSELARYGRRVSFFPQDECGLLDLNRWLSEPVADTLVYCCGPEPLLQAVEAACVAWPSGALRTERFAAADLTALHRTTDRTISVEFRASGVTVEVPPGVTILQAAEAAGLPVMSSCEEGICGTCETAVLAGAPEHRDSILTEAERQAGDVMMICCSRSTTSHLALDL